MGRRIAVPFFMLFFALILTNEVPNAFAQSTTGDTNADANAQNVADAAASQKCEVDEKWAEMEEGIPAEWKVDSNYRESGVLGRGFTYNHTTRRLDSMAYPTWKSFDGHLQEAVFQQCLDEEIQFTALHAKPKLPWTSPTETRKAVVAELAKRNRTVTLALFWGRRRYLRVLLPYVIPQLKSSGGIVDRVIIALNTEDEVDMKMATLFKQKYPKDVLIYRTPTGHSEFYKFNKFWDFLWTDTRHIIVRLNDDVVFFQDSTIDQLVLAKLLDPSYTTISANLINSLQLPALHQRMGGWTAPSASDSAKLEKLLGPKLLRKYKRLPAFQFWGVQYRDVLQGLSQHRAFLSRMLSKTDSDVKSFRANAECVLRSYMFSWFDHSVCRCVRPMPGYPDLVPKTQDINRQLPNCDPSGPYRWSSDLFVIDPSEVPLKFFSGEETFVSSHVPAVLGRRTGVLGTAVAVHALEMPQRKELQLLGLSEEELFLNDYVTLAYLYNKHN